MEALMASLLDWLSRNTDYDVADIPVPAVVQLDQHGLTEEYYRDNPELLPGTGIDNRVLALYSWAHGESGTVFILEAEETEGLQDGEDSLENPIFQERLLHELVHHVQYHSGVYDELPCRNRSELEAYQLGGRFLKQRHARDPLPNRNVLAYMYSRC